MGHILDEVTRAAAVTNTPIELLTVDETDVVKKRLLDKYSSSKAFWWVWEHLKKYVAILERNALLWLNEFLNEKPVIVVFNTRDEPTGVLIWDGRKVMALLDECYGFEYYLTNQTTDYLVCFNHEDVIYGAGKAAAWLQQKLESNRQEAGSYLWPAVIKL